MKPFGCLSAGHFSTFDIETSEGFDCEEVFGSGPFQNNLILLSVLALWVMHSHTLAFSLISMDVDHWCQQPAGVNLSAQDWKRIAIPVEANGLRSRCTVYTSPGDQNDTMLVDCDAWDFDSVRAHISIVSEWNLVCHRRSLKTLATAIFMAGSLGSLVMSAYCADHFGRRPVILVCFFGALIATLGCCFAKTYPVYVCTRFFISGCTMSPYALTVTILAESCSFARRPTSLSFSIMAGLMLADTSFTILKEAKDLNWFVRQLIMVAPTFLLPIGLFLIAESPRWLIASRRLEEAERVMRHAAKSNGSQADCVALLLRRVQQRLQAEEIESAASIMATDLTRVVRRRALIMFGSSFSVLMAYYSLLRSLAERGTANEWVERAAVAANAVAFGLLLKLVNRIDRTRLIGSAFLIFASVCCFKSIAAITPAGHASSDVVRDIIIVLAVAAGSVAMVVNFVYVAELFPTPFRGIAVCLLLAGGRLGGVVGALFSTLVGTGREDLIFWLNATVLYSSVYSFRHLPLEYGTYARLANADGSSTGPLDDSKRSLQTIEGMQQSLTSMAPKKKRKAVPKKRPSPSGRKQSQTTALTTPTSRPATSVGDTQRALVVSACQP